MAKLCRKYGQQTQKLTLVGEFFAQFTLWAVLLIFVNLLGVKITFETTEMNVSIRLEK